MTVYSNRPATVTATPASGVVPLGAKLATPVQPTVYNYVAPNREAEERADYQAWQTLEHMANPLPAHIREYNRVMQQAQEFVESRRRSEAEYQRKRNDFAVRKNRALQEAEHQAWLRMTPAEKRAKTLEDRRQYQEDLASGKAKPYTPTKPSMISQVPLRPPPSNYQSSAAYKWWTGMETAIPDTIIAASTNTQTALNAWSLRPTPVSNEADQYLIDKRGPAAAMYRPVPRQEMPTDEDLLHAPRKEIAQPPNQVTPDNYRMHVSAKAGISKKRTKQGPRDRTIRRQTRLKFPDHVSLEVRARNLARAKTVKKVWKKGTRARIRSISSQMSQDVYNLSTQPPSQANTDNDLALAMALQAEEDNNEDVLIEEEEDTYVPWEGKVPSIDLSKFFKHNYQPTHALEPWMLERPTIGGVPMAALPHHSGQLSILQQLQFQGFTNQELGLLERGVSLKSLSELRNYYLERALKLRHPAWPKGHEMNRWQMYALLTPPEKAAWKQQFPSRSYSSDTTTTTVNQMMQASANSLAGVPEEYIELMEDMPHLANLSPPDDAVLLALGITPETSTTTTTTSIQEEEFVSAGFTASSGPNRFSFKTPQQLAREKRNAEAEKRRVWAEQNPYVPYEKRPLQLAAPPPSANTWITTKKKISSQELAHVIRGSTADPVLHTQPAEIMDEVYPTEILGEMEDDDYDPEAGQRQHADNRDIFGGTDPEEEMLGEVPDSQPDTNYNFDDADEWQGGDK